MPCFQDKENNNKANACFAYLFGISYLDSFYSLSFSSKFITNLYFLSNKAEKLAHNFKMAQELYVVERIIKRKLSKQGPLYLVKWKGYPMNHCTWEPQQNLIYLQDEDHKHELSIFEKKPRQKSHTVRKYIKKKTNSTLRNLQRHISESKEMTPTRSVSFWEGKPEQTATSRKERIPLRESSDKKISIIKRQQNQQGQTYYVLKQNNKTRHMPEAQVKALFPTELCLYYQKSIKYHLLEMIN